MQCINRAAAAVFAFLSCVGMALPALSQQSQVNIAYEPPTDAKLRPIYEALKQRAVLEELQYFFNYVCVAYAASPLQFGGLVDNGILPKHRAERCDGEYAQIRKAFDLRIMPYVDPDLLIKVRSTPWLSWTPAKQ
jgi:hypothetical protein